MRPEYLRFMQKHRKVLSSSSSSSRRLLPPFKSRFLFQLMVLSATTTTPTVVKSFSAWTESQIKEAQALSITQRAKLLAEPGIFNSQKSRPVLIKGERWSSSTTSAAAASSSTPIATESNNNIDDDDDDDTIYNISTTKIIHFQRHGQGYHNLIYKVLKDSGINPDVDSTDPTVNPFLRSEIVDSPLTENGKEQCWKQQHVASKLNPELVVVSPLLRAIQTAEITFEEYFPNHHHHHQQQQQQLDHNINNNNNNSATSSSTTQAQTTTQQPQSIKKIPWIAHEGVREELGLLVCNKRRPLSQIQKQYPYIDYGQIYNDDDTLFDPHNRESFESKSNRIYDFLVNFILTRKEKEIVVVGHSAWLFHMCNAIIDCGNDTDLSSWFLTSEVRSMKLTFFSQNK